MIDINRILAQLGAKGATDVGGPGFEGYLLKLGAGGLIDGSLLTALDVVGALDDVYYVDDALGDDTTGTGTINSPLKTIDEAVARNITAGASPVIVYLRPGTYTMSTIADSAQSSFTLIGAGPEHVVISSSIVFNNSSGANTLNLYGINAGTITDLDAGGNFDVNLYGRSAAGAVSGGSTGTATIYPGSSAVSVATITKVFAVIGDEVEYSPATPGDWTIVPDKVEDALDNAAADLAKALFVDGTRSMTGDLDLDGNSIDNVFELGVGDTFTPTARVHVKDNTTAQDTNILSQIDDDTVWGLRIQNDAAGDSWGQVVADDSTFSVIYDDVMDDKGIDIRTDGRFFHGALDSAPVDATIGTSKITSFIDEGANQLKFRARYSDGSTLQTFSLGAGVSSTFLGLSDTPGTYSGQAGLVATVNPGETALEFSAASTDFLGLTDTPGDYSGQAGKAVVVNIGETALEFGTSSRTGIVRELYIDAADMVPSVTAGATADTEERGDSTVDQLLFAASGTTSVQFKRRMPDTWDLGPVAVIMYWDADGGASPGETVNWNVIANALSDDDPIDHASLAGTDVRDDFIAVGDLHVTDKVGFTIAGTPALDDLILFRLERLADDASDDLADVAKLLGVAIQYTESETEPSAWTLLINNKVIEDGNNKVMEDGNNKITES
jgi:hypothetical protein